MFAKKAFFIVVTVGAIYLAYQFVQTDGYGEIQSSNTLSSEESNQLMMLKAEVSDLQQQLNILTSTVETLNIQLASEPQIRVSSDSNTETSESKKTARSTTGTDVAGNLNRFQDASTGNKTDEIASSKAVMSNVVPISSQEVMQEELNKRLRQQSQLRAIAEKHQVAALSVLVD